jgi:PAS domain S-box-containing protein
LSLFGFKKPGEIKGRSPFGFSPEYQSDGSLSINKIEKLLTDYKQGRNISFNWDFILNNGNVINSHVELSRISDDIAAMKILSHNENTNHNRFSTDFRYILQTINVKTITGVYLSKPNGKLLFVNNVFANLLGYTQDELISVNYSSFTHPDDYLIEQKQLNETIKNRQTKYNLEKRIIKKNKIVVCVNISVSCIYGTNGELENLLGIISNINE